MAVQKANILGEVRGKVGDTLYRKINGKIHVSKVSGKHTPSQLPAEITRREKQKVNGKFGSAILKSPVAQSYLGKRKSTMHQGEQQDQQNQL